MVSPVQGDFKFRLVKINSFPNYPLFSHVCSTTILKTLWEKEKLLMTSNFSFSHSVFYPVIELFAVFIKFRIVVCKLFQFGRVQNMLFGNGLNAFADVEIHLIRIVLTLDQLTKVRLFTN